MNDMILVGGVLVEPSASLAALIAEERANPAPAIRLTSCSKLGLYRALNEPDGEFGSLWSTVWSAINANPAVRMEWDLATELSVTDPLVAQFVVLLNLDEAALDRLIAKAVELTA